ncbi:MAG TPA: hypothetical protein VIO61_04895 [Anaerolineaceae bacterium]
MIDQFPSLDVRRMPVTETRREGSVFGRMIRLPGTRSTSFASTAILFLVSTSGDEHIQPSSRTVDNHYPKAVVVPIVVRVIVVAIRSAGVIHIVVPRAATQRSFRPDPIAILP